MMWFPQNTKMSTNEQMSPFLLTHSCSKSFLWLSNDGCCDQNFILPTTSFKANKKKSRNMQNFSIRKSEIFHRLLSCKVDSRYKTKRKNVCSEFYRNAHKTNRWLYVQMPLVSILRLLPLLLSLLPQLLLAYCKSSSCALMSGSTAVVVLLLTSGWISGFLRSFSVCSRLSSSRIFSISSSFDGK